MRSDHGIQCVPFKQGTNMADISMNIILEGALKHRDGKKWKPRWCVIRKLSPVAGIFSPTLQGLDSLQHLELPRKYHNFNSTYYLTDRLHISLYRDAADYIKNSPEKTGLPLEEFLGIESCFPLDKEAHVMAIVCLNDVTLLAFQGRETLIEWEIRIRSHLGEEHQYPAQLARTPVQNKLTLGPVKFYIQGSRIGMTSGTPPRLLGSWHIADLRKFGVVENKLCFEVGSRCGKVSGLYVLVTEQGQEIADRMSQASDSKHSKNKSSKRRYKLCCHSIILDDMSSISGISRISGMSTPPPPVDFAKDFRDTEVYADLNFMSEPSPLTGSSVETTSTIFSDSSSDSERHKLVSIENLLGADNRSICDVPLHTQDSIMASNDLNFDDTLRRNELEDTNTLPRGTLRDELNISPELDDTDGCGMIVDNDAVRLVSAEDGKRNFDSSKSSLSSSSNNKSRLGSTTSSHSQTSCGSGSSAIRIFPSSSDSSGSGSGNSSQSHVMVPSSTSCSSSSSPSAVTTSNSSNGLESFLSTVHRNVDALGPKQAKYDQTKVSEVLGSYTSSPPPTQLPPPPPPPSIETTVTVSNGGGTCVFESHGQLREPDNEGLDLLDEVLRACNVDAFSSSSGGQSSLGSRGDLGVHSIHSSTCSIGSANQAGEGLSDGSNRTSPAPHGSARTSPARNSPVNTVQSLQTTSNSSTSIQHHSPSSSHISVSPAPAPPLLVPRSKSTQQHLHQLQEQKQQQSALSYGVHVSSVKCHNHSYVNVSGINSLGMLEIGDVNRTQSTTLSGQQHHQQQQQQQHYLNLSVPSALPDHSTAKPHNKICTNNSDPMNSYHDYVNVPALNGNNVPDIATSSSPSVNHPSMQHFVLSTSPSRPDSNWNSTPAKPRHQSQSLDPNKPLPYVDLECYNNDEEGYLYWVKGAVETAEAPVILTNPGTSKAGVKVKHSNAGDYLPMKGATGTGKVGSNDSQQQHGSNKGLYNRAGNKSQPNLSQYEHDHQDYVNMPTSTAKSVMAKLSAVRGKLLAYHDSLRRSKKPQVRRNTVDGSSKSSPKHSPKSSPKGSPKRSPKGSPKSDRNSLRTELFRSRGKSLEDILDASIKQKGNSYQADLFSLAPVEGTNNWSVQAHRPDSADGEYIQLTLSESEKAALIQIRDRHMLAQAAPAKPTNPNGEESTYILMTSDNRSCVSSPSTSYIQMDTGSPVTSHGLDTSYAAMSGPGVISNPFAKSPSPLRSPRSLRRTPPSVGAISPHTSPKKVRSQMSQDQHTNYMLMSGSGSSSGQARDEDDNAVFCAMELPLRSASSASHHSIRSRNCSFSSTASSSDTYHDDNNYLSMNNSRHRSNSSLGQRPINRPPLNQSKSLDMDYDGDYLHMTIGPDLSGRGATHGDYMCMNPSRDAAAVGASSETVRPFDDLIEHEPLVSKKPLIPPKPPTLTRKTSDASLASKSEDFVKSPPPSGKRDRFLSRLIRRNSSRERKNSHSQSKSQEDILKSPVVETLPEVPVSEPNTPSPYKTRMGHDPFGLIPNPSPYTRRASVDVPVPTGFNNRGQSMGYAYQQGWVCEEANLTDEQKQRSCISVASSTSSRHPSPRSDSPPVLPPRTYRQNSSEVQACPMPLTKKRPTPPPPPVESPEKSNSPDLDFLDRPISPNMPSEPAPPPPTYPQGSDTTLAYTDSNPNSTNTSTLTLLHISEEDDLRNDPPPELPEKTHRRKSSPGVMLSGSLSVLRRQSNRRCPSPTWHSQSELLLTDDSKACSSCESPSPSIGSRRDLTVHIPVNGEDEIDDLMGNKSNSSSRVSTPTNRDDVRHLSRQITKTDSSESQSLSSYGSADTTSTRSDDHKASPASTTLRPRFGKEYKKLDRRKLADEMSIGGYVPDGPRTPGSPSVASSVFTFDTTSLSSRMSSISGYSLGNDSPRSPPHVCGPSPRSPALMAGYRMPHDYVNVCMPRTESPRLWDMTPPGSPRSFSGASEQSNPLLNYAEIDLSLVDPGRQRKPITKPDIEYAMIDMVATAAASRAGKEHAQLREDSLRRKDGRRGEGDSSQEYIRRSKIERKNSSVSSSGRSEKKPSSRSGSKDRKFSAPN